MKTTIVTTTINVPVGLLQYVENARTYGHRNVDLVVIGDRKSPPEALQFCRTVSSVYPCAYYDIRQQQDYLSDFPDLWRHLRFDSIQRRNIGMLIAWRNGADVVVTIDDDNFVTSQDFIGRHAVAGSVQEVSGIGTTSGWFDVCSFLQADDGVRFYHRGYPQKLRWSERDHFITRQSVPCKIAVNAGFWLDDPDIDALTRMHRQPTVRGFHASWDGNFALLPGTWSPFNSQNTALMRDVIPAYFLSPYIGRYDDIWASYIINRIAQHFGHVIGFGEPLVRQQRNPHDLWRDLDNERNGMVLTDDFCAALRSLPLAGGSYHECLGEVAALLPAAWTPGVRWTDSQKEWREKFIEGLEIWHAVFDKLVRSAERPVIGSMRVGPLREVTAVEPAAI
jgi:Reversibly glycosylated polypeptide